MSKEKEPKHDFVKGAPDQRKLTKDGMKPKNNQSTGKKRKGASLFE